MKNAFHFNSIDHITLIVSDLERTSRFYCDVLGMEQVERPKFDFDGIWLQHPFSDTKSGRALIHATLESDLAGKAGWGDRAVGSLSRGHHFAFEIDDAMAACEHLKRCGVAIAVGPKNRPDGPTQFFVQDPDGHVIEFFSVAKNRP